MHNQPGAWGGWDDRGGWRRNPQPASADPVRALWPWVFPTGSRPVPVVGPTEALRGRAGGPGTAPPPGAVPGSLDPARRSSWQLAQEVWQESGVTWERTTPGLADVDPAYRWPSDPEPAVGARVAGAARSRTTDSEPGRLRPRWLRARGTATRGWTAQSPTTGSGSASSQTASSPPQATRGWMASSRPPPTRMASSPPPTGSRTPEPPTPGSPASARPISGSPTPGPQTSNPSASRAQPWARPDFADSGVAPARPEFPSATTPGRPGARSGPARPGASIRRTGSRGRHGLRAAGRVPLGAPVALDPQAPESADLTEPFTMAGPDGAGARVGRRGVVQRAR